MNKEEQVLRMTKIVSDFVGHVAKVLPDDVQEKITELANDERNPLAKIIYATMKENMKLAKELSRPSCQDTGVLQYWVKVGANYPCLVNWKVS